MKYTKGMKREGVIRQDSGRTGNRIQDWLASGSNVIEEEEKGELIYSILLSSHSFSLYTLKLLPLKSEGQNVSPFLHQPLDRPAVQHPMELAGAFANWGQEQRGPS